MEQKTETDSWTNWPSNLQPGANGHQGGRPGRGKTGKTGTSPPGNLSSPGLSSLEKTSGPQLYFSSRPRKAAKPGGWCQNQLQWLKTPCPATDQSEETMTLKGHLENWEYSAETLSWDLPKVPTCQRERKPSRQRTQRRLSLWGAAPFPLFFPHFFFTGMCPLNSKAVGSWHLVPG